MHTHPRLVQITALALGIAGAMAFSQAHAAAFLLKDNSVKTQGRSMAGAASAKGDASVVANNPAVLSTFDKHTFHADVTPISLSFNFHGSGRAAAGSPHAPPPPTALPAPWPSARPTPRPSCSRKTASRPRAARWPAPRRPRATPRSWPTTRP